MSCQFLSNLGDCNNPTIFFAKNIRLVLLNTELRLKLYLSSPIEFRLLGWWVGMVASKDVTRPEKS
jgi:hypothetical protein